MQLLLMYLPFLSSDPLLALPIHTSHRSSHSHFARRERGRGGAGGEGGEEKGRGGGGGDCRQLTFQTCKGGRGVPNVLDSLHLGPGPRQRVKEQLHINSFKVRVCHVMHRKSCRKVTADTEQVSIRGAVISEPFPCPYSRLDSSNYSL